MKYFISCRTPNGAALLAGAVVGQQQEQGVVERPSRSRSSTSRPIWASVCSRKAANASWSRAARRRWFSGSESHGSTPGLRGASSVSGGSRPISIWRANHRRGRRPSPSSNRPRYLSRYSAGRLVRGVHGAEGQVGEERAGRAGSRPSRGRSRWRGRPGPRSGGSRPRAWPAARRGGCRRPGRARTGRSRPRGSRRSGRSPAGSGHWS